MYINLLDTYNIASKLTFKRISNAYKVYRSYTQAKNTQQVKVQGMPISISIEPTTACNLRCPECPSGLRSFTRPTGKLDVNLFQQVIDELKETLIYLTFYFQGEPFLHPDLNRMIQYASEKGIYTATSTNAHFLSPEVARDTVSSGLDRMIISIDGATQETYSAYRKEGSLEIVLEGTENMVRARRDSKRKRPELVWQFLVVRPNEREVEEIEKLARQYGVDKVAFKTAQIYDYEDGNDLIPTIDKYSRYTKQESGKYELKHALGDECWKMWHSCVITWDGKVVPCCFDKDAHHELGNVNEVSFEEIWNSRAYESFRETLLTSRSSIEMCKNCSEGGKVWA